MKRNRSMLFHPGLYVETLRQLRLMGSIYLVLCVVFTIVPALLDSLSGRPVSYTHLTLPTILLV